MPLRGSRIPRRARANGKCPQGRHPQLRFVILIRFRRIDRQFEAVDYTKFRTLELGKMPLCRLPLRLDDLRRPVETEPKLPVGYAGFDPVGLEFRRVSELGGR